MISSETSLRSSFASTGGGSTTKPLPLKQRTSSVDTRKDISIQTWWSLRELIKLREYFITVDNFSIWKRHLSWALTDGGDLRAYLTQRFSSSMVFMSLILGAELQVLFNSAAVTTEMRKALTRNCLNDLGFWIGIIIITSVALTLFSLISTFTAWGMVSAVSDQNAHCILRSSIGQYVVELPGRLIVFSIYAFLLWVILFVIKLLPPIWSIFLVSMVFCGFVHIMIVFSAFGRIIMHTGAMGSERIFSEKYEQRLLPRSLQSNLIMRAKAELANNTSITRQYRRRSMPIDRELSSDDMSERLNAPAVPSPVRRRTESQVRFADELWSSIPTPQHHNTGPTLKTSSHHRRAPAMARNAMSPTDDLEAGPPSASERKNGGNNKRPTVASATGTSRPLGPPTRGTSSGTNGTSRRGNKKNKKNRQPFLGHAESSASLDEWLNGGGGTDMSSTTPLITRVEGNWATEDAPPRINRAVLSRGRSASEDQTGATTASSRFYRAGLLPSGIPPPKSVGSHTRILSNVSSIAATEDGIETELENKQGQGDAEEEEEEEEVIQSFGGSLDDLFDPESSSTISGGFVDPVSSNSEDQQEEEDEEQLQQIDSNLVVSSSTDDDSLIDADLEANIRSEHQSLLNASNVRDSILRPGYNSTGASFLNKGRSNNKGSNGGGPSSPSRKG